MLTLVEVLLRLCLLTLQLTDGLYSPHVEAEQFEAIQGEVRSVLDSFMEKLFKEHVQVCA